MNTTEAELRSAVIDAENALERVCIDGEATPFEFSNAEDNLRDASQALSDFCAKQQLAALNEVANNTSAKHIIVNPIMFLTI